MQQDEKKLSLQAGFDNNGTFTHIQKKIEVMTNNPTWVLMDDTIAQIENSRALEILSAFPIEIPNQQVDLFREQYFPLIAQALPIKSDLVQWRDIHADAVPRLYLARRQQRKNPARHASIWLRRIRRRRLRKTKPILSPAFPIPGNSSASIASLSANNIFINCSPTPSTDSNAQVRHIRYGTLELRARAHPFDFLMHSIPALTQGGL